jgi:2-polyprenyl-6-methoxyphenol hydroxylase-like FAD-dependent oxidoreductase
MSVTSGTSHAVVIGAGVAGLVTARVLADGFATVTVVERDHLPGASAPRAGVPQGHHVHGLLALGAQLFEGFFPGLRKELQQAGAPVWDWGEGLYAVLPNGTPPRAPMGLSIQSFSRPLLEHVLRGRVSALEPVTLRDGLTVTGLRTTGPGHVTGVRVRDGDGAEDEIPADLVVDASGRSTRLPRWLTGLGLPSPRTTTVDAQLGYASRVYSHPEGQPPPWMGVLEPLRAPGIRRGSYALRIENNLVHVTLHAAGTQPPRDDEEFRAFARTLRGPIAGVVDSLTPVSGIRRYARTHNQKTAYHRLVRWPRGLIAVGDSVCAFNPAYGQGMTVAALEARLLRRMLRERRAGTPLDSREFQKRLARVTTMSWLMSTMPDRAWERVGWPVAAGNWFMNRMIDTVPHDVRVYEAFSGLFHMTAGPLALADPRLVARVLAGPRRAAAVPG